VRRREPNKVRIIGGRWRSRIVSFARAENVRPTPDRVRETLFNWLGQDLSGRNCLDLFAGSGALGFEALSRGAESVVMVDSNPLVIRSLRNNAARLGAREILLVQDDALEFLGNADARFDVIFIDPPYRSELGGRVLELLPAVLAAGGRVYLESGAALQPVAGWTLLRCGRAGQAHFHLLAREADDKGGVSGNVRPDHSRT